MTERPKGDLGKSTNQPEHSSDVSMAALAGLGLQFVLGIFIFLYLGKWIDSRFGTAPVGTVAGVFIGAAGSFYAGYRRLTAAQRRDDELHGRGKIK